MLKAIEIDLDVNRAIETARGAFDETPNAILRRLLSIDPRSRPSPGLPRIRSPRSSGAYSTLVEGTPIEANSLKGLLRVVLLFCAEHRHGLLEALAETPTPRGRRIVARRPEELYPKAPHLVEYAERLNEGWWYDGNVGRDQLASYFRVLARLARLSTIPTISKRSQKTAMTPEDLGL